MVLKIFEENHIVTVTLNRPEVRNAFNQELIANLTQAFLDLSVRRDLRAIVLKGEGKSFCAGADLQMMQSMVSYTHQENQADADQLFLMFETIAKCPHPIISVVHGAAFGGALGLMACSDIVICEENTQLCFSEVKLGIVPAVISAFVLRKTSLGKAGPWMISAKLMKATDAVQIGIAHAAVSSELLEPTLKEWLQAFQNSGPEAVRESKKLIAEVAKLDLNQSRPLTTKTIADRRISKEGQEGLKSFLEKRTPAWRGQS